MRKLITGTGVLPVAACLFISGPASAVLPFENTGNLYVSMWNADEVAVFTPDGQAVTRFTADGLDGPRGIAFNPANGDIWIAGEFSNSIFIFDRNHQLLRTIEHPDFDEPVGVTFESDTGGGLSELLVYISNSNGNEIMVFDQQGTLQRRFTDSTLNDPNCSAFLADGSLVVTNRLGGSMGNIGSVAKFDANENFQFDFSDDGIASLMAVARDTNGTPDGQDDTLWATSGAGNNGIYEFDQNGNLLQVITPRDIDDGSPIVPQGIAFQSDGSFVVVSFLNEVLKFDADGNFLMRFPTGAGTARSTAFAIADVAGTEGAATGTTNADTFPSNTDAITETNSSIVSESSSANSGGSGRIGALLLALLYFAVLRRAKLSSYKRFF